MAKIPLRAYIKDIENLIERGEIEQAIAHAKNVLKSYPKHIGTYRLLGKAFLESQRYSEAADILQRVLSVLPDDFVSQIGMSIIREDEGNIDASIWHMERAYEVQPFNPAVQDELRRLYGRRDGIEPPKIRLTRGALIRMYTRGELYPQAIAETRAALAEDPQRLDLLVLLARLYYLSNQKVEATEVSSTLISKLPYCLEANQILAEILPATSRSEDAKKFQQRIFALDPYAAFITPTALTPDQVSDQAVMVEQFIWDTSMKEDQTPQWTRDVGVEWEEDKYDTIPDWMVTLAPDYSAPPQPAEEPWPPEPEAARGEDEPSTAQEDLVPDWMKVAGWVSADQRADEIMAGEGDEAVEEEIAPAEIPDWLQSMAPPEAAETITGEQQPDENDQIPEWMLLAQAENAAVSPKDEESQDILDWAQPATETSDSVPLTEPPIDEIPEWLQGVSEPKTEEDAEEDLPAWLMDEGSASSLESSGEAMPDWMSSFQIQEESPDTVDEVPFETEEEHAGVADEVAKITFLSSLSETLDELNIGKDDTFGWFADLNTAPASGEGENGAALPSDQSLSVGEISPDVEMSDLEPELPAAELEPHQPASEMDDWLKDTAPIQVQNSETQVEPTGSTELTDSAEMPDLSDMDAALAWMEGLAARQGADEATLSTPPEERLETPPDWLQKEIDTAELTEPEGFVEQAIKEETLPEWLEESLEIESEADAAVASADIPLAVDGPEVEQTGLEAEVVEETPDEAEGEGTGPLAEAEEPPPTIAVAAAASALDDMDIGSAFAWLESLAARQGADEETLITPPEERVETPPEWVVQEQDTQPEVAAGTEGAEYTAEWNAVETPDVSTAQAAASTLPEWLQSSEGENVADTVDTAEDEIPDWLKTVEEQPPVAPAWIEEETVTTQAQEPVLEDSKELPEWLQPKESDEISAAIDQVPQWMESEGIEETPAVVEPTPQWMQPKEGEEAQTDIEPIPDWIASIEEDIEIEFAGPESLQMPPDLDISTAWTPEPEMGGETQPLPTDLAPLQEAFNRGDVDTALLGYRKLIQNSQYLPETIQHLRNALYRYPVDIDIWQTLGDAYSQNNQFQEALDAYTKAEDLLR